MPAGCVSTLPSTLHHFNLPNPRLTAKPPPKRNHSLSITPHLVCRLDRDGEHDAAHAAVATVHLGIGICSLPFQPTISSIPCCQPPPLVEQAFNVLGRCRRLGRVTVCTISPVLVRLLEDSTIRPIPHPSRCYPEESRAPST